MKFLIKDLSGSFIVCNFDFENCSECEHKCKIKGGIVQCPLCENEERRQGIRSSGKMSVFLCCEKKEAKTTKLFNDKIETFLYTSSTLKQIYEETQSKAKKTEQSKYEKIVHNLKTINAQSFLAYYNLFPQETLMENHENQMAYITNVIEKNTEKAAILFLRLAKNNASIKTEFGSHEKLSLENPVLAINRHNIRKVILNVFHSFALELQNKGISMFIFEENKFLMIDYETVRLAFYHMFDNISKYAKEKSKLIIECQEVDSEFLIRFRMNSLHIEQKELESIFEDHYSGKKVKEINKQGSGLGMGIIRKALQLNGARIEVVPGKGIEKIHKNEYSKNEFHIYFGSENQLSFSLNLSSSN